MVPLQPFPVRHFSRSRYVLFGLCNVDEVSLSPFSAFKHTLKYFGMWMANQCFVCSLSRLARNCNQDIIGIDKCVNGPFPATYEGALLVKRVRKDSEKDF